jgi:hypothetical protein
MNALIKFFALTSLLSISGTAMASGAGEQLLDLTNHWVGFFSIGVFILAYMLVMAEEYIHLRKSKPVMLAAGIIWAAIAAVYASNGMPHAAEVAVRHNL